MYVWINKCQQASCNKEGGDGSHRGLPLLQVDVWGVGFRGEQRRPAGGRGPGSQSGRSGEPLVQDARPRRVQVAAAAAAAATPVQHLYWLPAEVSVMQRNMVWPSSLWDSCCCAADNNSKDYNDYKTTIVQKQEQPGFHRCRRTSDPNRTECELFTTYPNVSVLPHRVDKSLRAQVCCFHIQASSLFLSFNLSRFWLTFFFFLK